MSMRRIGFCFLTTLVLCSKLVAELPEVTEDALVELGSTYGTPQMNGFVFVEGRYIPPPYTVTRKGNGIFINRIQVEQPLSWARDALSGAEGGGASLHSEKPRTKKALDADGDFEQVDTAVTPAAGIQAVPAETPVADPGKTKAVKSIDDLFADEEKPASPVRAAPEAGTAVVTQQVAATAVTEHTPEEIRRGKDAVIANLERLRKGYEQALSRGDIFFFGQRHNRVNGNLGTARMLMKVLPQALRSAESPNDLWQSLKQGGVYFIDLGICVELFKNRMTFTLLEERQRNIEESDMLEARKRRSTTVW